MIRKAKTDSHPRALGGVCQALRSSRGQVAIVILLLVALGLVFFAVTLNFSIISGTKVLTMTAANATAAQMASYMASYGEKLYREALGGHTKKCGWSVLFQVMIIVGLVIIIIVIVVVLIITSTLPEGWPLIVVLIGLSLAITAAIVAVILVAVVVEPGLTSMYNKIIAAMSITNQFTEQAIQTALTKSETDDVKIPDLYDLDADGVFGDETKKILPGPDGIPGTIDDVVEIIPAPDYVSRFGMYYRRRVSELDPLNTVEIEKFQNKLRDFLIVDCGGTGWGIYDPLKCSNYAPDAHPCCPANPLAAETAGTFPAVCDPCCLPQFVTDRQNNVITGPDGKDLRLRPECCDLPNLSDGSPDPARCGDPNTCGSRSPYGVSYPWMYDTTYEDSQNKKPDNSACLSFLEKLGRDDEHHLFRVTTTPGDPNSNYKPNWQVDVTQAQTVGATLPPPYNQPGFYITDASGYYRQREPPPPAGEWNVFVPPPPEDEKHGMFPYLYKILDWGTELSRLKYTGDECHWCDPKGGAAPVPGASCPPDPGWVAPAEIPRLTLAHDPGQGFIAPPYAYDGSWCVDSVNLGPVGSPPQVADKVILPGTTPGNPDPFFNNKIFAANDACAMVTGGWKKGADQFCDPQVPALGPQWPYNTRCVKHRGQDVDSSGDGITGCVEPPVPGDEAFEGNIEVDCSCGENNAVSPTEFVDDRLDIIAYRIKDFIALAQNLVDQDLIVLTQTFREWYDQIDDWIEPPCCIKTAAEPWCGGCPVGEPCACKDNIDDVIDPLKCNCPGSFSKLKRSGFLWLWRYWLTEIRNPIRDWEVDEQKLAAFNGGAGEQSQYVGTDCADVWCVPPGQPGNNLFGIKECDCVRPEEAATFDSNKNGVRGDLEDVIACLRWNVDDIARDNTNLTWQVVEVDNTKYAPCPAPTPVGVCNPQGQEIQADSGGSCALFRCMGAPIVNLATGNPYRGNAGKFEACMTSCSAQNCSDLPRSLVPDFCADHMIFNNGNNADQQRLQDCLTTALDRPGLFPPSPVPPDPAEYNQILAAAECNADCNFGAAFEATYSLPAFNASDPVRMNGLLNDNDNSGIVCTCKNFRANVFMGGVCEDPIPHSGGNPPSPDISCGSPTAFRNDVEAAICQAQRTCCDFPPDICSTNLLAPVINPFYDALKRSLEGICGYDWYRDGARWSQTDSFLNSVYNALGSCYGGSGGGGSTNNMFELSVMAARNIADNAADLAAFNACLADIGDGQGCRPGTCDSLPTKNQAGVPYNILPYVAGIMEPVGSIVCDDSALRNKAEQCVWQCSAVNCIFPSNSCNGRLLNIPLNPPAALARRCLISGEVDGVNCDDSDIASILSCLANCEGNAAVCATLPGQTNHLGQSYNIPAFRSPNLINLAFLRNVCLNQPCDPATSPCHGWNGVLDCNSPTYYRSDLENCAATYENSCSGWGVGIDADDAPNPKYYDAVANALGGGAVGGSCADPAFQQAVQESYIAAQNQVIKFEKRLRFLEGRKEEADRIAGSNGVLTQAIDEITKFIDDGTAWSSPGVPEAGECDTQDSPAECLIQARISFMEKIDPGLASFAIYVWRDKELPPDKPRELPGGIKTLSGYWHAVKVDVRLPRRCNNACGAGGGGNDPEWPRVKATTESWGPPGSPFGMPGMRRCYELRSRRGMVKARVVRFDENPDSKTMLFPNKLKIWDRKMTHPQRTSGNTTGLDTTCAMYIDKSLQGTKFQDAFMISKTPKVNQVDRLNDPDPVGAENAFQCWKRVHDDLLANGVSSESCAEYFFSKGGPDKFGARGFKLKFVPCDNAFINGSN